jgi:hypothetical protein
MRVVEAALLRWFSTHAPRPHLVVVGLEMPWTLDDGDLVLVSSSGTSAYLVDPPTEPCVGRRMTRCGDSFDRITFVVDDEEESSALVSVPAGWGVVSVGDSEVLPALRMVRSASALAPHDVTAVARLLWRDELAVALEARGYYPRAFDGHAQLVEVLARQFAAWDAHQLVVSRLLRRATANTT